MDSAIVGLHVDEHGDWVAELACGHVQHVRHDPPWTNRPWTQAPEGRAGAPGRMLACRPCDPGTPAATI